MDSELSSDGSEIDLVHSLRRGTSHLDRFKTFEEEDRKLNGLESAKELQKRHSRLVEETLAGG